MAVITMTFANTINSSVQVGDTVYKCIMSGTVAADPILLGTVTAVTSTTISCNITTGAVRPTTSDFIMFSKDNEANLSSIDGYYAEVEMKNDSNDAIEIHAMGSEIFESSK